jgi:heat shock protein HtpX
MSGKSVSHTIDLEVPDSYLGNLLDFIYQKYLLPQKKRFANVQRGRSENDFYLTFATLDDAGKQVLQVEIKAGRPIRLDITPLGEGTKEEAITQVRQDITIAVELFEEKARESTLFFAWREGQEIVPETSGKEKKSLNHLFLETQVLLFIIFIAIGLFLFPSSLSSFFSQTSSSREPQTGA